jgi:hypothetical protein
MVMECTCTLRGHAVRAGAVRDTEYPESTKPVPVGRLMYLRLFKFSHSDAPLVGIAHNLR